MVSILSESLRTVCDIHFNNQVQKLEELGQLQHLVFYIIHTIHIIRSSISNNKLIS
jgi:hypothetical protein